MASEMVVQLTGDKVTSPSSQGKNVMIVNLEDYIQGFLIRSSSYSDFLQSIGEKNVSVSEWSPTLSTVSGASGRWKNQNNKNPTTTATTTPSRQYSRIVTYLHPVSNPLAPPLATTIKNQTLTEYDD